MLIYFISEYIEFVLPKIKQVGKIIVYLLTDIKLLSCQIKHVMGLKRRLRGQSSA